MATSVAEQIAVKVRTRLLLIDEDSGYETTAAAVERPRRVATFTPKDYNLILTQGNLSVVPELSHPGNPPATAWLLPFTIAGTLMPSSEVTTAVDTLKNQFWSDVVKALTNATSWHNWDGLAINSEISGVEDFQASDGSGAGFKVTLDVTFRTDEDDPYTVRG